MNEVNILFIRKYTNHDIKNVISIVIAIQEFSSIGLATRVLESLYHTLEILKAYALFLEEL